MERIRFQDVRTGHEAGQRIDPVQSLQLSRQARIDVRHSQWAQWDSSCNCWSRQRLTLGTVRLRQGGWICAEVLGAGTVPINPALKYNPHSAPAGGGNSCGHDRA
ncbi:MAG: hypothetical protein ACP5RV_11930, partial [Thiomonas sp.]